MSNWNYIKTTLAGDEEVGPVSSAELFEAIVEGHVRKKTRICSSTVTDGKWVLASQIPRVLKMFTNIETAKETQTTKKDPPKDVGLQKHGRAQPKQQEEPGDPQVETESNEFDSTGSGMSNSGLARMLDEHRRLLEEIQVSTAKSNFTIQVICLVIVVIAILLGIDAVSQFFVTP